MVGWMRGVKVGGMAGAAIVVHHQAPMSVAAASDGVEKIMPYR
jgi:hypothetical protein